MCGGILIFSYFLFSVEIFIKYSIYSNACFISIIHYSHSVAKLQFHIQVKKSVNQACSCFHMLCLNRRVYNMLSHTPAVFRDQQKSNILFCTPPAWHKAVLQPPNFALLCSPKWNFAKHLPRWSLLISSPGGVRGDSYYFSVCIQKQF